MNESMVAVVADKNLAQLDNTGVSLPADWQSRRLYFGEQGAKNWLGVAQHPKYALHTDDAFGLNRNRLDAIENCTANSFVSLGPGDAIQDIPLVQSLQSRVSDLQYIPVDISRPLLIRALDTMKDRVKVPAALFYDYENIDEGFTDAIGRFATQPRVFSLLGGGFGNLDLGEERFLKRLSGVFSPADRLLLDIPLAGPAWTPSSDPRLDKGKFNIEFRRFVAFGMVSSVDQLAVDARQLDEEQRLECEWGLASDIPATRVVSIRDKATGRVLLRFCRFDWEALIGWFQTIGFQVYFQRHSLASAADTFGMGVVLIGPLVART